jgi:hypothetical protein
LIEKYTNISFTEKQKENIPKLFDILSGNGLVNLIISEIPQEEYDTLTRSVYDSIDAYYSY